MSHKYKIRDPEGIYFITCTVIDWVDVFIRQSYRDCLVDSFKYCIENKGLNLHAYVMMTSHFHAIVSSKDGYDLVATIRDLKRHTSSAIIKLIQQYPESRREWLLKKFQYASNRTGRNNSYKVWKDGYYAKQLETNDFLDQKLAYIHENPVKEGWVSRAEDYLYSSARNYTGEEGVIDVNLLD